jgi:hypothetical protein
MACSSRSSLSKSVVDIVQEAMMGMGKTTRRGLIMSRTERAIP